MFAAICRQKRDACRAKQNGGGSNPPVFFVKKSKVD